VIFENCVKVQNKLSLQVREEFQWSQEWLIERFDTINTALDFFFLFSFITLIDLIEIWHTAALDVDAIDIDSVPKPVNFVALIHAAVNEGFSQIVLNTKVAENARWHQAIALQ